MVHFGFRFLNSCYAMPSLDRVALFVRNPDLIATNMDGDTVVMSIEHGKYYGISGVGSRVWALLEFPVSMMDIVQTICNEFEVEETTCLADMERFIEDMKGHGLVSVAER